MSEELGKYSLKFAGQTYTSNDDGDVTIHQNWEGTADGYGAVFGTLISVSYTHLTLPTIYSV